MIAHCKQRGGMMDGKLTPSLRSSLKTKMKHHSILARNFGIGSVFLQVPVDPFNSSPFRVFRVIRG